MSNPPTDADLAAWIREHTRQLLGVARAFAADDVEAEDVLQEVWLIAARRAHRRPAGVPLGAWLHLVTLNRGRSLTRRARRRRLLLLRWTADARDATMGGEAAADATATARGRLWRAVAELPALQRDVVVLRLIAECSTRETAARLGRAEGTVKASLHRALRTLRVALGAEAAAGTAARPDSTSR